MDDRQDWIPSGTLAFQFKHLAIRVFICLAFLGTGMIAATAFAEQNNPGKTISIESESESESGNEAEYIDEDALFDDIPTVVSATRLKQKIVDAPVSVTIIDSDMITASGATEVHELLRLVPGFFAYSVTGNQFSISSHFEPSDISTRLEVQVNGRSVYEPLFTSVDWTSLGIDVADIDHIEVIRGSSATAYGSNAFLGAINIVTKNVVSRPKMSVRTTLGNIGRKDLTFNHTGSVNDLVFGLSLVSKNNTGFSALDNPMNASQHNKDDRHSLQLGFQGSYTPDLKNEIEFEVGLGQSDIEIPTSVDARGFSNRDHKNNYQKAKWVYKAHNTENTWQFYHNYFGLRDDLKLGLLSEVLGVSAAQIPLLFPGHQDEVVQLDPGSGFSERFDLEFQQQGHTHKGLDFVWGAGARRDSVKSRYFFGPGTQSQNRYRLFGNLDWRINDKANTNIGLMIENTALTGSVFSPRIALNLHPEKHQTIRASITRGNHIPSVTFEHLATSFRFSDGSLINTLVNRSDNLSAEKMTAYELGYMASFPSVNTQFDVRLFREEMDDFVVGQIRPFADLDSEVRTLDNIANLTTQGVELQMNHRFAALDDLSMRLTYAYFDTDGTYLKTRADPDSVDQVSSIPKHSGTLMLRKKLPNQFDLSSVLQYQSDLDHDRVGVKRVDLRLGKKLKLPSATGSLDFVIQNAFNKYHDFTPDNLFESRAFVRLQLDF